MAQGRGVQLEWAIVYESLVRAGVPYSEIDARAKKHSNLKAYDGAVGAQAKACVDKVEASNPKLLSKAYHSDCLLYTSPSPRDQRGSRMPSSA